MPRYTIVTETDRRYVPIRYDNFHALGALVEPPVPHVLVPLHADIGSVLEEARGQRKQLDDELAAIGVGAAGGEQQREIGYHDRLNFPFRLFRGERSMRFNIMPTRYRFTGEADLLATTRERIGAEMQRAEQMKHYLHAHGWPEATLEQARAAVRHYGVPSAFVDFTFDPEVAAFFAHPAFTEVERTNGADIGIFYSLGIQDFDGLFGMAAWGIPPEGGRDIHYINIASEWRIPFRSFDPERESTEDAVLVVPVPERLMARPITIRTRTVPGIARIEAQEGVFLDAGFEDPEDWWAQVFLWTVLDFASRKWCFLRQDSAYENADSGVTAAALLPRDGTALEELTRAFFTDS